ncbi:MAG TPA: hypothetical protein VHC63_02165 [Acidimicrobiales bacterium]|nr:hypothetical protein [Acidimicrobiales bacterium]
MTDEAHDDASRRLSDAIASEWEAFGPHTLDDNGDVTDVPIPGAVLDEWVLVMSWVDPSTGTSLVTRASSAGLPLHHENGLLHEALYRFD